MRSSPMKLRGDVAVMDTPASCKDVVNQSVIDAGIRRLIRAKKSMRDLLQGAAKPCLSLRGLSA